MTGPSHRGSRRGFTLIEILAVVAILALVAAFTIPNLGAYRTRALRHEGERLASQLEFARQRAIVTGVPHRLWLDLDQVAYRLEWLGTAEEPAFAANDVEVDLRGNAPLPLAAPQHDERSFEPVPGLFGRAYVLEEPFVFQGLETPQGFVKRGESDIVFERDGTASYTEIYITDGDDHVVAIDVFPLDDHVRIRDAS